MAGYSNKTEFSGPITPGPMLMGDKATIDAMPLQTPSLAPAQPQPVISQTGPQV